MTTKKRLKRFGGSQSTSLRYLRGERKTKEKKGDKRFLTFEEACRRAKK